MDDDDLYVVAGEFNLCTLVWAWESLSPKLSSKYFNTQFLSELLGPWVNRWIILNQAMLYDDLEISTLNPQNKCSMSISTSESIQPNIQQENLLKSLFSWGSGGKTKNFSCPCQPFGSIEQFSCQVRHHDGTLELLKFLTWAWDHVQQARDPGAKLEAAVQKWEKKQRGLFASSTHLKNAKTQIRTAPAKPAPSTPWRRERTRSREGSRRCRADLAAVLVWHGAPSRLYILAVYYFLLV